MSRFTIAIFSLIFAAIGSVGAQATEVEIAFSPKLAALTAKINAVEKKREERFRRFTSDRAVRTESGRLANSRFSHTRWAGAELIPKIDDYTIGNLLTALVENNLQSENIELPGETIRLELKALGITGYPISVIGFSNSYAKGTISRVETATGKVIETADVIANLFVYRSLDTSYDGPDLAFAQTDMRRRIGPTLTHFVKRSLEKLFPDHKFRRAVVVGGNL